MASPKQHFRAEALAAALKHTAPTSGMLPDMYFVPMICVERKRIERSGDLCVLMLLDLGILGADQRVVKRLATAITQSIRITDIPGWYEDRKVMGVIFTGIGAAEENEVVSLFSKRMTEALYHALTVQDVNQLRLSFHVFPENWDAADLERQLPPQLQPPMPLEGKRQEKWTWVKRLLDLIGSALALIILLPVFLAIAIAVRSTSEGPVFFRQVRLGRCGKKFTFLKFRSMYMNNDHTIHKEFVERFIKGEPCNEHGAGAAPKLYKLTADPRITPMGRFLRKTSLDELPQLWNVFRGDMSLVGPRPPVSYEFERYERWHRQRLAFVRPGITGLWQVEGRSRVKFDDMIRLDLRYARVWSLWLDFKILVRTPWAVFSGEGAV